MKNTSTGRHDNSKASWFRQIAMDQSKTIRGATNFMEQSRRAYEASDFIMETDYAELEKRIMAAYADDKNVVVVLDSVFQYQGVRTLTVLTGTIADQKTWEPRLTCGNCGFRAATNDMFHGHWNNAHKVITNRA